MTMPHSCKQIHLLGGHCRSEVRLFVRVNSPVENAVLRNDSGGKGHFGASRRARSHNGIDLATTIGQNVYSPISGKISKVGWANATHRYVEIEGLTATRDLGGKVHAEDECIVRVMYVKPSVLEGQSIENGAAIGKADDLHRNGQYPENVGQHVHVEIKVGGHNVNPEMIVPVNGI